jgi:hypothetical protein
MSQVFDVLVPTFSKPFAVFINTAQDDSSVLRCVISESLFIILWTNVGYSNTEISIR